MNAFYQLIHDSVSFIIKNDTFKHAWAEKKTMFLITIYLMQYMK